MPLRREHAPALAEALSDPAVWTYLRIRHGDTPEHMAALVEDNLALKAKGDTMPYTVLAGAEETPVGVIRFLDIHREDQWVEIGTWLGPEAWRTPVNTEAKYLLLRLAFDTEGAHRVQLKTDARNQRSQTAIVRLGAVPEGALREHYRFPSGQDPDVALLQHLGVGMAGGAAASRGDAGATFRRAVAPPRVGLNSIGSQPGGGKRGGRFSWKARIPSGSSPCSVASTIPRRSSRSWVSRLALNAETMSCFIHP